MEGFLIFITIAYGFFNLGWFIWYVMRIGVSMPDNAWELFELSTASICVEAADDYSINTIGLFIMTAAYTILVFPALMLWYTMLVTILIGALVWTLVTATFRYVFRKR